MKGWADKISRLEEREKSLKIGIVAANNHYGGFGPGTVNKFREMLNLEPKSIKHINLKETGNQLHLQEDSDSGLVKRKKDKQTSISDFL
jgi:hypothetical protein